MANHLPICIRCGNRARKENYNELWDCYACEYCVDNWTDDGCSDLSCELCSNRPARPSLAGIELRNGKLVRYES